MSLKRIVRRAVDCMCVASGVALMVAAIVGRADGGLPPPTTPEIDPGSLASALVLLAGGVMVLRGRIRR